MQAEAQTDALHWAGPPLWSTLRLLLLPAVFLGVLIFSHFNPGTLVLYGFAALFMVLLLLRLRHGPEALLATAIMYLPQAREYGATVAPGVNGTNVIDLLLIGVWVGSCLRNSRPIFTARPFTRMVGIWAFLSLLSVPTAMAHIGISEFMWNHTEILRTWLDQFIVFYTFVNLIRDRNMARRLLVYMMIAAGIVYLQGLDEWFGKINASSIEKSRLLGPVLQSNEFGALMICTAAPFLAYGVYYFPRMKAWMATPVLAIFLRVLLGIFSRAAYMAFAAEFIVVSTMRSKKFLILVVAALAGIYFFAPQLIPSSMQARIGQTYEDRPAGDKYDKSAEQRLILWQASENMIEQSPLLGKGFDMFHELSNEYVDTHVNVNDTHNMYLYIATQMGLPAMFSWLAIILALFFRGRRLYRQGEYDIDRIIGLGGAVMVPGLLVMNMFGSHMVDTSVDGFFWVYLAIVSHLLPTPATAPAAITATTTSADQYDVKLPSPATPPATITTTGDEN